MLPVVGRAPTAEAAAPIEATAAILPLFIFEPILNATLLVALAPFAAAAPVVSVQFLKATFTPPHDVLKLGIRVVGACHSSGLA